MFRILLSLALVFSITVQAQQADADKESKVTVVEASCGLCNFGLKGGCDLAIRIDGAAYPVKGVDFHSLGDAHGDHGMCNVIRSAEVEGELKKGVYHATSFKLLALEEK